MPLHRVCMGYVFVLLYDRYRVDGSAWSKQLPTIVLFDGGKERVRRPYVDRKGTVQKFFFSEVRPTTSVTVDSCRCAIDRIEQDK